MTDECKKCVELTEENDKLRYYLANAHIACIYCGLAWDEMSKCASGFPGCARSDDLMVGEANGY